MATAMTMVDGTRDNMVVACVGMDSNGEQKMKEMKEDAVCAEECGPPQ